jgi:hypothetical protein
MADDGEEYVYSDNEYEYDDDDVPVASSARAGGGRSSAGAAGGAGSSSGGVGGAASPPLKPGQEYRLLHEDEIEVEMQKIVREVASILDMPPECATTLLTFFK